MCIAFALFSRQNSETYTIHFVKTNPSLKGISQVINQGTAKYLVGKCKYINREQDVGVEGLRRAKLSYNPVFLQEHFILKPRSF